MKTGIHPEFVDTKVMCACGTEFITKATKNEIKVDVCSNCHPLWTGNLKHSTTGGRADKFKKKYGIE